MEQPGRGPGSRGCAVGHWVLTDTGAEQPGASGETQGGRCSHHPLRSQRYSPVSPCRGRHDCGWYPSAGVGGCVRHLACVSAAWHRRAIATRPIGEVHSPYEPRVCEGGFGGHYMYPREDAGGGGSHPSPEGGRDRSPLHTPHGDSLTQRCQSRPPQTVMQAKRVRM